MNKEQQINNIIATHDNTLLISTLWNDPVIIQMIRKKLEAVSIENMPYYYNYFCRG